MQTGQVEVHEMVFFQLESQGGQVELNLSWAKNSDLDLYLTDLKGVLIGQAESESDPEMLTVDTGKGGSFSIEVYSYSGVTTDFTLDIRFVNAVTSLHISLFYIRF